MGKVKCNILSCTVQACKHTCIVYVHIHILQQCAFSVCTHTYTFCILMKKRIVPNHCWKNLNLRLNQEIMNLINRIVVADTRERAWDRAYLQIRRHALKREFIWFSTVESKLSKKGKLAVCLISIVVMDGECQTYYKSVCVLLFITLVLKILRRQC